MSLFRAPHERRFLVSRNCSKTNNGLDKRRGEPKRKEKRAKKPSRPCRKFSGDQRTHRAERTSVWDDYKVAVERQICSVFALDSSILCCLRVYANGMSSLSV